MDCRPLPPSEFLRQDAFTWFRAVSDQRAYRDGIEQARKEAEGGRKVGQMLERRVGAPEA